MHQNKYVAVDRVNSNNGVGYDILFQYNNVTLKLGYKLMCVHQLLVVQGRYEDHNVSVENEHTLYYIYHIQYILLVDKNNINQYNMIRQALIPLIQHAENHVRVKVGTAHQLSG